MTAWGSQRSHGYLGDKSLNILSPNWARDSTNGLVLEEESGGTFFALLINVSTQHMYTFLKALDEKRSNPWYSRCQSFTEKKIGLKGTSPLINPNTFTFSMSEIVDF